ncbi:hypothetical protein [Streptomyces albiflavescens]|nr:hypothetical protein [Streptomyces albiflavescens]
MAWGRRYLSDGVGLDRAVAADDVVIVAGAARADRTESPLVAIRCVARALTCGDQMSGDARMAVFSDNQVSQG